MMQELVRLVPSLQQLCYAHGLQLVIQDLFYKKQSSSLPEIFVYSSEYEEDQVSDEEDTDGLTVIGAGGIEQENPIQ